MSVCKWNLVEVIVDNGIKYKDNEAILLSDPSSPARWLPLTWEQYAQFTFSVKSKWVKKFGHIIQNNATEKPPVAGVHVRNTPNSITPYCVLASIGFTVLAIYPDNSDEGKIRLCEKENVQLIIVESSSIEWTEKYQKIAPSAQVYVLDGETEALGRYAQKIESGDAIKDVANIHLSIAGTATQNSSMACPIFLLNSSGSTGIPKTIPWDNMKGFLIEREENFCEPSSATWSVKWTSGFYSFFAHRLYLFWLIQRPWFKLVVPRFETTFDIDSLIQSRQSFVPFQCFTYVMKYLIEDIWALGETPEENVKREKYIEYLRRFPYITQSGGLLDKSTYVKALELGIKIRNVYGTSETGGLLESDIELLDETWKNTKSFEAGSVTDEVMEKIYLLKPMCPYAIRFEVIDGLRVKGEAVYELVVDATNPRFSSTSNANDGTEWRAGDLFRKKTITTRLGREINGYLYEGRFDDVIELENKKKYLLPVIEKALRNELEENVSFGKVELTIVGKTKEGLALLAKDSGGSNEALCDILPSMLARVVEDVGYEELAFLCKMIYYLTDTQQFIYTPKKALSRLLNGQTFADEIRGLSVENDC